MDSLFVEAALERSSLARELKAVHTGLITTSAVSVRINDWLLLATSLADSVARKACRRLRPYHTLLLLEEPDVLLAMLPPDAAPQVCRWVCFKWGAELAMRNTTVQMVTLIKMASPLKNFSNLHVRTSWGLCVCVQSSKPFVPLCCHRRIQASHWSRCFVWLPTFSSGEKRIS